MLLQPLLPLEEDVVVPARVKVQQLWVVPPSLRPHPPKGEMQCQRIRKRVKDY